MREIRFTSQSFVTQGETGEPEAYIDPAELQELKKLAGIQTLKEFTKPISNNAGQMSPLGSNISVTGMEKRQLEKEHNIKPGSPEWFRLWFSRPYLTSETPIANKTATLRNCRR